MLRSFILLILSVLLISSNSECTALQSTLSYMVTGVAELGNPIDTFAKEDYSITFSSSDVLGNYANIFSAFSIIGLQTTSGQNFYSVTVDQVVFSNTNRVMRFIMDYNNNDRTVKTQWSKVKLSYIVVSPEFEGIATGTYTGPGNSYVFAKGIEYNVSRSGGLMNQAVDTDPLFNNPNTDYCGYIDVPSTFVKAFGTKCPPDAKILYHYYVMGFRYDSTSDSSYEFRVSVRGGDGLSPNQNTFSAVIQPATIPNGPKFTIESQGGNLKTIKIGVVLTVLRDYSSYPANDVNAQKFKYSGVFMPVSLYNTPISITTSSSQNLNHFDIGYNKYVMYGFSSIYVQPNTYLDFNLQVQNLYQLQITSQNMLSNVIVSADFYSSIIDAACTSTLIERTQVRSEQYTSLPATAAQQQTLNKIASSNGILTDASNQYVFDIKGFNYLSSTDTISMTIQLVYDGLTAGEAYVIETAFDQLSATDIPSGTNIRYTVSIDGAIILNDTITTDGTENDKITKIGRNIATTTATFVINIMFARNPLFPINFKLNFALLEVDRVYDSINQCCSTSCPAGTGLNVKTSPFTCVSCNSSAGQFYNSLTAQCECNPGFFLVSSVSQICTPCTAKLCAVCNPSSPSICQTCVSGASYQFTGDCVCNAGLFPSNNSCTSCGAKCSGCDTTGKCLSCSDPKRDLSKGCSCADGFYDNGGAICLACSSSCKTCSSSNVCTSCDSTQNKRVEGGLCVCSNGFFSAFDTLGNLQCQKCAAQCDSCIGNAWTCTSCDPTKNKVSGYDSSGRLTCLCAAGYTLGDDGSCSQTDCTKDPYCLQCSTDSLKICLACKPSINRVLDTNTYRCVCREGFYPTSTGECVVCPSACATCTNSSYCGTCVAGATRIGNTCSCAGGSFFVETPTRYCKSCQDSCIQCNSSGACLQCLSTYQLTTDGRCVCGVGKFTNANGQCTSCLSETCSTCKNATTCLTCISGYLLQQNECISSCSEGFYRNGSQCLVCSSGCAFCTTNGTCQACSIGLNLLDGKCYSTCPTGTLTEQSTGKCAPCNAPCRTCVTHPSVCTSCEVDATLSDGKCVSSCSPGTYPVNGTCRPCDFSCATCMGSARMCTSCPDGLFLFNGACYSYCPRYDSSGKCIASCSPGFYQSSNSGCSPCGSNCQECISDKQCTKCATNLYSYLGDCLVACPSNTLVSTNNSCLACDVACRSCENVPTQCLTCSTGYSYDSRTKTCSRGYPTANCAFNQFLNRLTNQCENCLTECLTCSERSQCLSCPTGYQLSRGRCIVNIQPSQCRISNCDKCNSNNQCTQCSLGYFLNNNSCVSVCPYPTNPVNGVCKCATGILYQNSCITACPNGFTAISGTCQKCDSSCKQCSEQTNFCTSCNTGYQLNVGSKQCELVNSITCPYGQYLEGNLCYRYCNNNLVYMNGLCYTTCLSSYADNGNGGCVLKSALNCVTGQFLLDSRCVTSCPVTFFVNSSSGKCESCPLNCNQCSSSTFCTTCTPPYIVNSQGICYLQQATSLCLTGKYELNGNCFSECPVTYFANTGNGKCENCPSNCNICSNSKFCTSCTLPYILDTTDGSCITKSTSSVCAPGIFQLNGYCFSVCPVGYWTNKSTQKCEQCPQNCAECSSSTTCISCNSPFVLKSSVCTTASSNNLQQTCSVGYYLNTLQNLCYQCRSPCATCSSDTICLTCVSGLTLVNGQCVSSSCSDGYFKDVNNYCQACQSPCKTCSSISACTSCVLGYQLNGNFCQVVNTGNLVELSGISVDFSYKRGNSVIVRLSLPIIPDGLTQDQKSRFFTVKQSNTVNTIVSVTQWMPDNFTNKVFVMVNYASIEGSAFMFLSVNANVMSGAYASKGYFINEKSYKAVSVYQTMEDAPTSILVPISVNAVPYALL